MSIIVTSLKEFISRVQKESDENKRKADNHLAEIKSAPNNVVQMPQVKKPAEANRVQQPVIQPRTVIPPKTGGCGCWGNK